MERQSQPMFMQSNELNQFLMPNDSPIAQNQGQVSAFQFDYSNEAGIISTSKIRNASIGSAQIQDASIGSAQVGTLSFNQINGGTATLGGTTNGNGVLLIKDAGGTTKVQGDNTGITITDGKLTFVNSASGTVLDSSGIVSATNFVSNGTSDLSARTATASSYVDISNTSLNVVLARSAQVLFLSTVQARIIAGTQITSFQSADLKPTIGGTTIGGTGAPVMNFLDEQGANTYFGVYTTRTFTMSRQAIMTVGAGTSVFKLQGQTSAFAAGGTLQVIGTDMNYVILGS